MGSSTWIVFSLFCCSSLVDGKRNIVLQPKDTPSFAIDYQNGQFLLDGQPFRYISGSIHYFRIHPSLWEDRLKVRALGFNAVQFYIPWNFHEVNRGELNFEGWRDFAKFIQLAAQQELFTILRIGPYSCGEWENGGLPSWLIKDRPDMKQRSSDTRFTTAVSGWYEAIAGKIRPLLRNNGGPVLMVQIDNEYGLICQIQSSSSPSSSLDTFIITYTGILCDFTIEVMNRSYDACDHAYMKFLRNEAWRFFGKDTVVYTTDGGSEYYLQCGATNKTLTTVDFGPTTPTNIAKAFDAQRQHLPHKKGPLVNSEFYPGWLVLWGQQTQDLPSLNAVISSAKTIYSLGASISFYMIHGGTNFGFWNGAEPTGPVITSYDYSAPITESGNYSSSYYAIREWIKTIPNWPNPPTNPPEPIHLSSSYSKKPRSFEDLDYPLGYVIYNTTIKKCGTNLTIPDIRDFGYVTLDGKKQGTFVKKFGDEIVKSVILNSTDCRIGVDLRILVENQGRQTYETINDFKGILSPVFLDGALLEGWTHTIIQIPSGAGYDTTNSEKADIYNYVQPRSSEVQGCFHGAFQVDKVADTYVNMKGWGKGHVEVNGFNIGRYWSTKGPQYALYVPAGFLRAGSNEIRVFELEGASSEVCLSSLRCTLKFSDQPMIEFVNVYNDWHLLDNRKESYQNKPLRFPKT